LLIGAIRDMKNPPVYGDPDRMGSPLWYTGSGDNGGVHTNCGVNNKLCYLLTDGGTFNGHTVTGMGITKIADLYYEVQTNLLTSGADYTDLYSALTQAAINLGWTSTEKQNLEQASQAVEIAGDDCPATEYYSTDAPKTIADLTTTRSTIVISQAGTITDINVKLNITHSWDADLDVFLIAPDGTRVELFTDVGSSGENFANTILDDEAATAITSGTAPFAGSYRPEGSLAVLDGKSITGTWTLEVIDDMSGITGTLNSWSLIIKMPCSNECQTFEDFEMGDFSTFPWIRSGNANWTITSSDKNTGNYCAKSGTIGSRP
jgi:subtilisin-like proprotein convertase family protein